jgi:hypothetical protein
MPNIRWLLALVTRLRRFPYLNTDGAVGASALSPVLDTAHAPHADYRRRTRREIPIVIPECAPAPE